MTVHKIPLTNNEIELLLELLPVSWSEEGKYEEVKTVKYKLNRALESEGVK